MLTQAQLKELLHYDPETGLFIWVASSGCRLKGERAGSLHHSGYMNLWVNKKQYRSHRLAWFYVHGVWPIEIDHINHIRDDNRLINLREATRQQNNRNASRRKDNTSGISGVSQFKGKWRARIRVNKKEIHLGYFDDKFEAVCAKKSAERKHGFSKGHGK
jgi:hypothetical protein